ncbi:uncharacterized protein LOC133181638 [Saccostrea echinata]|uniref:uncharacterized protein LOC133181638 n=1 Tax=Saccostrea echinata TaxID=191078 RepID=UPI002A810AD1|nr:uncharacterized protein LOC133181638 [Saccostrea echinata]
MALVFACPVLFIYGIQSNVMPVAPRTIALGNTCKIVDIKDSLTSSALRKIFMIIVCIGTPLTFCILIIIYSLIAVNIRKRFVYVCKTSGKNETNVEQGERSVESKVQINSLKSVRRSSALEINECIPEETTAPIDVASTTAHDNSDTSNNCTTIQSKNRFSSQNEKNQRARSQRVTLMLFLVTVIFILTSSTFYAVVIIRTVQPYYYTNLSFEGKAIYQFFVRFYFLSMSANPVLYSCLSEQFRTECGNVLRTLWKFPVKC